MFRKLFICVKNKKTYEKTNNDEEIIAYYFSGAIDGYAIIGINGEVIEFSEESIIEEFNNSDDKKSYYSGPGEYDLQDRSSKKLIDIESNQIISKKDIQTLEIFSNTYSSDICSPEESIVVKENQKVANM